MSSLQERCTESRLIAKQRRYAARRDANSLRHSRRQDELSRKSRNQQMRYMVPRYRDISPTMSIYLGHAHPVNGR